jgi:GWxTD domain-containing protein
MAHLYNPQTDNLINPSISISHIDYERSKISLQIPSAELLYTKKDGDNFYLARFQISIKVFKSIDKRSMLYSSDFSFFDTLYVDNGHLILRESNFPLTFGSDYWLHVEFKDLNRRNSFEKILFSKKSNPYDSGFFTITSGTRPIQVSNNLSITGLYDINLIHSHNMVFTLEVNRYQPSQEFPAAPYVIEEYTPVDPPLTPDTTFRVAFINGKANLKLPGNGLYRFSEPGSLSNGFSLHSFWDQYPNLPENEKALYPLRYLTSSDEFNSLFALRDYRLAQERFWARIAGNPDRGAAVMQRFNDRVIKANQYFGSHLPGWQTDMGMIYIVFGPPDMVFIGNDQQNWYYTESLHTPATEFIFILSEHTLSENHFVLQRNQSYRRNWNIAVDRWRR